jgi:DNA (cytosine-5)-methyltransferase 1
MNLYEFFAGGGMARIGLGPGWKCTFANDDNHDGAMKTPSYVANFGRGDLIVGDVARLTTSDLPGIADLAWASPPCQDFSLAGDRAGLDGERSSAVWPFLQLMQALHAEGRALKIIAIENVDDLATSNSGADHDALCDALGEAGYRAGAVVIDAKLFVPQSRERLFIIAVDADPSIPAELVADEPTKPFHTSGLIAASQFQRDPIWWRLPIPPKRNTTFADIIENTPTGATWNTQAETDQMIAMMSPVNLAKLEEAKLAGRRMVGGLYRRSRGKRAAGTPVSRWEARFDDVAGCLRMPTGGSSRQTVMIVDGERVRSRLLSPREAARLMGLPDEYKLPLNYDAAYGLIGDGVCVPVVRFLAAHTLEPILRRDRQQRLAAE